MATTEIIYSTTMVSTSPISTTLTDVMSNISSEDVMDYHSTTSIFTVNTSTTMSTTMINNLESNTSSSYVSTIMSEVIDNIKENLTTVYKDVIDLEDIQNKTLDMFRFGYDSRNLTDDIESKLGIESPDSGQSGHNLSVHIVYLAIAIAILILLLFIFITIYHYKLKEYFSNDSNNNTTVNNDSIPKVHKPQQPRNLSSTSDKDVEKAETKNNGAKSSIKTSKQNSQSSDDDDDETKTGKRKRQINKDRIDASELKQL